MRNKRGITLIALIITIIVMMILVGVTVNVALNGGLFDIAKQAVSGMNMAQIEERAYFVKYMLIADAESDANIKASKAEYKARLLEEFNIEETTTYGSNIIEVNDKYVIIIKNSDLDIEVFEKTKIPANYLLVALDYETSNIEQNGKVYGTNVAINITRLMNQNQYIDLKKEQAPTVSDETKKQAFLEYCNEWYYPEEEFTSIDDVTLFIINSWGYEYETLEEALLDESVQVDFGKTKGEAYFWALLYDFNIELEDTDIEENQAIDAWYANKQHGDYEGEYYDYTNKINLYLAINGVEKETPIKELIDMRSTETITVNYRTTQNGTYEFILKTRNGEEIAREILRVNNIETDNPYAITKEEAEGVWITDGVGTITGYLGTDTEVIVPLIIDGEIITTVGGFKDNTNITSVTIPEGVTKIGTYAFSNCTSLEDIKIPETITSIGSNAFAYCENLTNIAMPNSIASLGTSTFYKCTNLTSITIPEGVTSIGNGLFNHCERLTDITIPETVTSIKDNAFYGCKSLTNLKIPEAVTSIEYYAFYGCESLTSIIIPEGVTSIEFGTFGGCTNLTSIIIPEGVTSIGSEAFDGCTNLTNITIPNGVISIGEKAFRKCENLTNLTIPETVTSIEDTAFYGCKSLTNLTIPDSVTSIGNMAFYECRKITNIKIPEGVTYIGNHTFFGCRSLTSITIPESVTSIGASAFGNCINLTSITIPNSVIYIGAESNTWNETYKNFAGCTNLTTIYFAAGDNPIPKEDFAPWGAPNENVQVIKLEQEQTQDPNEETGN